MDHILQTLNNHNQFDTLCRAVLAPIAAAMFRQGWLEGSLQSSHMPERLNFKQEVVPHDSISMPLHNIAQGGPGADRGGGVPAGAAGG